MPTDIIARLAKKHITLPAISPRAKLPSANQSCLLNRRPITPTAADLEKLNGIL